MKADFLSGFLIFISGMMIPLAIAFNTQVSNGVRSPLLSAAAIPVVGVAFAVLVLALLRPALPSWQTLSEIPWYAWLGGAMVTLYFIIVPPLAPRVGLGFAVSLVVAGQLAMSAAIDHFGLLGLPVTHFSLGRFAGAILVIAGVVLLKFF